MTSNGRIPQNIKSGISQLLIIGSSSTFKLKMSGPNQNWSVSEITDQICLKSHENKYSSLQEVEHALCNAYYAWILQLYILYWLFPPPPLKSSTKYSEYK